MVGLIVPSWAQSFVRWLLKPLRFLPERFRDVLSQVASLGAGVGVAFVLVMSGAWFYWFAIYDLPTPQDLLRHQPQLTTKIYDRNGVVLYRIYKDENRTLVPLNAVPHHLRQATIAIEDKEFYQHWGISLRGIARAVRTNLETESIQGGSTITQQLVKNTLLTPERTVQRKVREIILALMIESTFTKEEILQMYLNEIAYGGTSYGVEEASQRYFGKTVKDLSLAESSYLAGLPQAPSAYSPFGPTPERGIARQHQVLQRMVEDGFISEQQAAEARQEQLVFQPKAEEILAPHFVMYVRDLLASTYGEERVASGGLEVYTTLDYNLQQLAEESVRSELKRIGSLRVSNGAALVTDPRSGEILAMVGSKDYFDFKNDGQVNVTIQERQPGSSIKPLTYAVALEKGMTPSTIIDDAPITYRVPGSPPYSPQNYDGRFRGKVTVRTALASSLNIPAVKTLAAIGVPSMIDRARQMGITTWGEEQAKRFGLSLTLGGGEVKMVDMAVLYGTFANDGVSVELDPILKVIDARNQILYTNPCAQASRPCNGRQTLDSRVAYQITDILADNAARAPAFGLNSVLNIKNNYVAVKTGTTNNLRDNWTIGYTDTAVVLTWVGNNDNSPMSAVASGITGASPIWSNIMTQIVATNPQEMIPPPSGLVKRAVCVSTGTLPCAECPVVREEYFISGNEPRTGCSPTMFASAKEEKSPPQP